MLTSSFGNWTLVTEVCFRCCMPAAVNCKINDTDTTTRRGKTTNFKNKKLPHSFHTTNISYRHISSQPQFYINRQTRALG